jgi:hypothetical protein
MSLRMDDIGCANARQSISSIFRGGGLGRPLHFSLGSTAKA